MKRIRETLLLLTVVVAGGRALFVANGYADDAAAKQYILNIEGMR